MGDSAEEDNGEDDENGILFHTTTKLYEEYKLTDGSAADQWAREANSKLQLNWQDHPTELSHYSHGDLGGLGFMSTMEKKLGMVPSNQTYRPQTHSSSRPIEPIPTQDWELAGVGGTGGFQGVVKSGADLGGGMSSLSSHLHWNNWVNDDYDDEGNFHFTTSKQ